jgi:hypothetical protein
MFFRALNDTSVIRNLDYNIGLIATMYIGTLSTGEITMRHDKTKLAANFAKCIVMTHADSHDYEVLFCSTRTAFTDAVFETLLKELHQNNSFIDMPDVLSKTLKKLNKNLSDYFLGCIPVTCYDETKPITAYIDKKFVLNEIHKKYNITNIERIMEI